MKKLIIIPTYNELENIQKIIPEILDKNPGVDILVVDDSSPDGTGRVVESLSRENKKINLLSRKEKKGLGKAYLAGFQWGLDEGYDVLVEMDADFSHRPEDLVNLLKECGKNDFVVGSRYVPQGQTVNWSLGRIFISRFGSLYARCILGYKLKDWTGGFNAWKRGTLEKMGLENIQSNGYSFQIELKYRALRDGFEGIEVPIVFEDRQVGQSKMSLKIVIEAFFRVWQFRWKK